MDKKKIIKERIKDNEKIFNSKQLKFIQKNQEFIMKIYMLGSMDTANTMLGGNV